MYGKTHQQNAFAQNLSDAGERRRHLGQFQYSFGAAANIVDVSDVGYKDGTNGWQSGLHHMGEQIAFPRDRLPTLVIIEDENVSSPRLLQVLESIFVDGEIDCDGDVYVSSGLDFPVWISIDAGRKYVNIFTCIGVRDVGIEAATAAANDLNKRLFLVKFHTDAQALWGNAWVSFDGGLSVRQFVRTLRRFAAVFQEATNDDKVAHLFRTEPGA